MSKKIYVKRIYDDYNKSDGIRILVDRLWPRGIKKDKAEVDVWLKEISPSSELRKWFSHDPAKWNEFKRKYFQELDDKKDLCKKLINECDKITLLFSARDIKYNNAVALKEYLERNFLNEK
jgi:uncharacterized protein YeaO (DUF488 family)